MSLHGLPVELLHIIAQDLDIHALAALAQTCSILCDVAQGSLYRHICVSAWSRNLCVVALLANKPSIARHVRSFYIAIDSLSAVFPSYYRLLSRAILNMSELTSLNLLVDSGVSWVLKDACTRTSYPHLAHFTCSFPFDENVVQFLTKTPSLLELEVDSIPSTFACESLGASLSPATIPRLEQFIGSPRTARLLVPGRPVKSLHLNGGALTDEDITVLAQSTAPILVLGAVTNSSPLPFLEQLHRYLPHLAYLRIMTTQTILQPPAAEFYEQVADVLASFPELSAFELSGVHWGSQQKRDDGSKRVWQSSPLSVQIQLDDEIII
ncbi:hypothetical protein ID866_4939 [Astraeus odoratus]|nr:hypothetical protein ID866_4939 [Astraeus odoratus]